VEAKHHFYDDFSFHHHGHQHQLQQHDVSQNFCETPDEEEGKCVPLRFCPFLEYHMSIAFDNRNFQLQRHIRRFVCGFGVFEPKFCCPLSEVKNFRKHPGGRPGKNGRPAISHAPMITTPLPPPDPEPFGPATGHGLDCGQSAISFRIVGGNGSSPGEWPWATAIGRKGTVYKHSIKRRRVQFY
jgi:hypothetical protein